MTLLRDKSKDSHEYYALPTNPKIALIGWGLSYTRSVDVYDSQFVFDGMIIKLI